jgi:S1-C subfamily serine protease
MTAKQVKKVILITAGILVLGGAAAGGAISDRLFGYSLLDKWWPRSGEANPSSGNIRVVTEESMVTGVVERASPSVVTVGISTTQKVISPSLNFSNPFGWFGQQLGKVEERKIEEDIGSGFVISKDGLIVTNKHVVDTVNAKYRIITADEKTYEVQKIYRDPANDLAILKIDTGGAELKPVEMGDSGKLKVGQSVVAIGTALGEFRHTVTTGVVSGLGRGIEAGSVYEGSVEKLDDVIQTDAAINPGNSGGPLLNSAGQVIGINTAVSAQGQNIGFAIPINIIKEVINNFNETGQFSRPYLGIRYRMLNLKTALQYEVPSGAYVQTVIEDSPAAKAGIQEGDIITKIAGKKINGEDENSLTAEIGTHKVGETVEVEIYRSGETKTFKVGLEESQ